MICGEMADWAGFHSRLPIKYEYGLYCSPYIHNDIGRQNFFWCFRIGF